MQQHGRKYLPADRPYTSLLTVGVGSIGLNSTFLEHGHVA